MLKELHRRFQSSFIFLSLLTIAACQVTSPSASSTVTLWLQPDNPALVNFPLGASTQIYTFNANPSASTEVTLTPLTPDLPYKAEIHDNRGNVMASINSAMQNAVFTIGPSDGLYEVAIQAANNDQQGMLSVMVSGTATQAASANAYTVPATNFVSSGAKTISAANVSNNTACSAQSSSGTNVNIRNGPGLNYTVIASLIGGRSIAIVGSGSNGWYPVDVNGQTGWISGSVITLSRACTVAPTLTAVPTSIPTATAAPTFVADPNTLHLDVDRDGWGNLSERLASTDLHPQDLIQVSVDNLAAIPGDDYREFTLTLICTGDGTDAVRWGAPEQPTLECGHSIIMPFTTSYAQQIIAVSLAQSLPQSSVSYTLLAAKH